MAGVSALVTARGLKGLRPAISDAHRRLLGAAWQRRRTHYLPNLLIRVPAAAQPWVATIFDRPDAAEVPRSIRPRRRAAISRRWPRASCGWCRRKGLRASSRVPVIPTSLSLPSVDFFRAL